MVVVGSGRRLSPGACPWVESGEGGVPQLTKYFFVTTEMRSNGALYGYGVGGLSRW